MIKVLLPLLFCAAIQTVSAQEIARWKATDLEQYLSDSTGPAVKVVNMWATFCKPCIAEIPGFIRVKEKWGNQVELMLVSVDLKSHYPEKIRGFVRQHQFNARLAWLDETNADYFCPKLDAAWSGSIPATLIINTRTGYRKFFEEEISEEVLEKEIRAAL